jgi:hypothetical protein
MVAPCKGFDGTARTAVWLIVQDIGEPHVLGRVTYGRVPQGYVATHYMSRDTSRAEVSPPLTAGCYVAAVQGTGRLRFVIAPDGSALQLPDPSSSQPSN